MDKQAAIESESRTFTIVKDGTIPVFKGDLITRLVAKEGGCPTCGGTGNNTPCDSRTLYKTCPACHGTGERREVKRRETDALVYTSVYPDGDPAVHMFVVCKDHHAPDRRSGKEHRK